jgi:hypothetical protein
MAAAKSCRGPGTGRATERALLTFTIWGAWRAARSPPGTVAHGHPAMRACILSTSLQCQYCYSPLLDGDTSAVQCRAIRERGKQEPSCSSCPCWSSAATPTPVWPTAAAAAAREIRGGNGSGGSSIRAERSAEPRTELSQTNYFPDVLSCNSDHMYMIQFIKYRCPYRYFIRRNLIRTVSTVLVVCAAPDRIST